MSHKPPPRIFIPSLGPSDWRRLLGDPYRHWKRTRSAWELAVSWESGRDSSTGLPPEVEKALETRFGSPVLLLAVPEHRVDLGDGRRPSQNDLWALVGTDAGLVSMCVEAKAGEDFDLPLAEWNAKGSPTKASRLKRLCEFLGLEEAPPHTARYQLFHRTAAALIEALRWRAAAGVMLVQSFGESPTCWEDFSAFASLLGAKVERGVLADAPRVSRVPLLLGWVDSRVADDARAAIST